MNRPEQFPAPRLHQSPGVAVLRRAAAPRTGSGVLRLARHAPPTGALVVCHHHQRINPETLVLLLSTTPSEKVVVTAGDELNNPVSPDFEQLVFRKNRSAHYALDNVNLVSGIEIEAVLTKGWRCRNFVSHCATSVEELREGHRLRRPRDQRDSRKVEHLDRFERVLQTLFRCEFRRHRTHSGSHSITPTAWPCCQVGTRRTHAAIGRRRRGARRKRLKTGHHLQQSRRSSGAPNA